MSFLGKWSCAKIDSFKTAISSEIIDVHGGGSLKTVGLAIKKFEFLILLLLLLSCGLSVRMLYGKINFLRFLY